MARAGESDTKGLDYETHYLQGVKREHEAPEFLKINPRARLIQWALDCKAAMMSPLDFIDLVDRYSRLFDWMQRVGVLEGLERILPYHC